MLNNFMLVGRIYEKGEGFLILKVSTGKKDNNEDYANDYIKVYLTTSSMIESVENYCQINDIIGVKGRIESYAVESDLKLSVEKLTFLTSRDN